jgi:hypothetical protein
MKHTAVHLAFHLRSYGGWISCVAAPSPQLHTRVAFKCLLVLDEAKMSKWPPLRSVLSGQLPPGPEPAVEVLDIGWGKLFQMHCLQAGEGAGKSPTQRGLCVGPVFLSGIRPSSQSCREVPAWHHGWPQA